MIWEKIKNRISKQKVEPDKKEWLDKLVDDLADKYLQDMNLPFKIMELKKSGFLIKVSGLYAYISFLRMPWKYSNPDYWIAIAHKLTGKVFFGRIFSIKKEPSLSIIVSGEVPQFKKNELIIGETYRGIIVEKVRRGAFVETGYHFDWRCGSFVGFLKKSLFKSAKEYEHCAVGDEIDVEYQGLHKKNGELTYTQASEKINWKKKIPHGLIGQTVSVDVVNKEGEEIKFLVEGKYKGKLDLKQNYQYFGSRKQAQTVKKNLEDGDVIHCEVLGAIDKERVLKLKWIVELDFDVVKTKGVERVKSRRIENNIDDGMIEKLKILRDEIASKEMEFWEEKTESIQ
jgi:hypothetical protein